MKKTGLLIAAFFLCMAQSFAQGTVGQADTAAVRQHTVPNQSATQNQLKWEWIALGIPALLAMGFSVSLLLIYKIRGRTFIINTVLNSKRINEKFASGSAARTANSAGYYNLTDRDINHIVDKALECIRLHEEEKKRADVQSYIPRQTVVKYLKGKSGKLFGRAEYTPEDSFFRMANESGDTADFEFFGNEEEAIAKRVFHADICQIASGNYQSAHAVKMNKPGKIKKTGEHWEVIEPISITLL
ncbi:MAG: hypothetical protein LBJ60_05030 [Tannerellaceae bacterium]|jgi:hypothetical protein|nr:hypothetical protein [Tannerellaceae bacterium]